MTPQFKQMMALFNQTGKMGYRHTYCWEASRGRTESTRELTATEIQSIIHRLQSESDSYQQANRMRRKLISMAREMGWSSPQPSPKERELAACHSSPLGRQGGDIMQRIDHWCEKYGQFHKPLMGHTLKELPLLISQFERVYKSFLS